MFRFLLVAAFSLQLVCSLPQTIENKELAHVRSLVHDLKENLYRKTDESKSTEDKTETDDGELHAGSQSKRGVAKRSAGTLSDSEKQEYVDAHNEFRRITSPSAANMKIVKWNDDLAAIAAEWAAGCSYTHNADRTSKQSTFGYVGENKYINTGGKRIHRSVEYWDLEKSKYDFNTQSCSEGICTHYTQVVWHNSEYIGCGIAYCSSFEGLSGWAGYYHVCNYGPGGNYEGQTPYTSGDACSSVCNNGLVI